MKELIVLALISVVLVVSGCVGQQAGQNQTQLTPGTDGTVTTPSTTPTVAEITADLTTSNAALYSDVSAIADEAAAINTTDLDTVLTPLTTDDLTVD